MARPTRTRQPADMPRHNLKVRKRIMPASKLPKRFRALIYGKSGAGKTRLASSAPKVLLIDVNEEGTDSVRNDLDPDTYEVKYWSEINDIYWYLQSGEHEYLTVALDGLTGLQDLCMKFVLGDELSRDASRDPDMPSRQVWGKVGELMKTQISNYRNLPMHVIFTATDRKRFTGDQDESEDVELSIGPALSPAIAGAAERAVGMIGYLHKRQVIVKPKGGSKTKPKRIVRRRLIIDDPTERYATKDRYGLHVPHIDSPDVVSMIGAIYGEGGQE